MQINLHKIAEKGRRDGEAVNGGKDAAKWDDRIASGTMDDAHLPAKSPPKITTGGRSRIKLPAKHRQNQADKTEFSFHFHNSKSL